MATRIQVRRDTAANWTAANPTLAEGELGLELDTLKFKAGNGTSDWKTLNYCGGGTEATTATKGTVQLADSAAILAGTAGRVVDAAQLKANVPAAATDTAAGSVELATAAEVTAGTDTTRAVTPAGLKVELDKKAPLASPALTGTPTAPTAAAGTNTTQIATTAFVNAATPDASEAAKGLVELATAAETTTGTDTTRAVHPAGLKVELDKKAPLASPALTGTPTAPTAAAGTNTTQLATTAFVAAATPDASTTVKGLVQLADAAAVTAGTAGRVVDAAQLKAQSHWSRTGTELAPSNAGDTVNRAALPAATVAALGAVQLADSAAITAGTAGRVVDAAQFRAAIFYNRRPALHRGSLFYKTAAATVSIVAGAVLNGQLYPTAAAVTMPASFTTNADYAIWQHPATGALVADASFTTAPAGAVGGSIVGGFHYIPAGRPTAFNGGSPTAAAEILEYSLWDLTWRPSCPDPRGMACIEEGFWIDLYFAGATSYAGNSFSAVPSSRFGLTIADASSPPLVPAQYGGDGAARYADGKWYVFSEMARSFGKRLPTYDEFSAAAFGAPEASSRGTDPGTVLWERVSKFGLSQATGTLWTWGQETCTTTNPTDWTTESETYGRGQVYGAETRAVIFGGYWGDASDSGSRAANWGNTPWNSGNDIGARFCCGHSING